MKKCQASIKHRKKLMLKFNLLEKLKPNGQKKNMIAPLQTAQNDKILTPKLLFLCLCFFLAASGKKKTVMIASVAISTPLRAESDLNHQFYASKHDYQYVSYHNKTFFKDMQNMHLAYQKVGLAHYLLEKYGDAMDYLLLVDNDAVFMNCNKSVYDIIAAVNTVYNKYPSEEPFDIIFSGDQFQAVNTGTVLFRSCQWSRDFVRNWFNLTTLLWNNPSPSDMSFVDQTVFQAVLGGLTADKVVSGKISKLEVKNRFSEPFNHRNATTLRLAMSAREIIPHYIRSHVAIAPQKLMNSYLYSFDKSDWIIHFAGYYPKHDLVSTYYRQSTCYFEWFRTLERDPIV
ncbi:hypothetical protein RFI_27882 [Reticulomyxa filosa]|uniref:Nucleotide-diphospho-sugar transferase domain-containing protein n=1 Tax=Reticulomyxa filosa TaxID=46433 RepID=X6M787_RETFI|nr:hypothetical protein RFI_27882 [Reticulomyxa filosa]|eukprot:ETO09496.1 hypothetical protein RFI_27882 [Reticulomyxa filosa]